MAFPLNFSFSYTDFYNNGLATPADVGNLSLNPEFVSTNDYHLTSSSLLINVGDPSYTGEMDDVDMDGGNRLVYSVIDMGVDEFNDVIFLSGFE